MAVEPKRDARAKTAVWRYAPAPACMRALVMTNAKKRPGEVWKKVETARRKTRKVMMSVALMMRGEDRAYGDT